MAQNKLSPGIPSASEQERLSTRLDLSAFLFDANPVPMWIYDRDTLRFIAVNEAAAEKYGYSRDQFLSMTLADILPAEDRHKLRLTPSIPLGKRGFQNLGSVRHVRHDGSLIDVEVASSWPIKFDGRPASISILFDVTARERVLKRLQTITASLEESHDLANVVSCTYDIGSNTVHFAGRACRTLGVSEVPLADAWAYIARAFHPDDLREARAFYRALRKKKEFRGEARLIVDNQTRWYEGRTHVVRDEAGTPTTVVGVGIDVTARKLESERLRSAAFTDRTTGLPNRLAVFQSGGNAYRGQAIVLVNIAPSKDRALRSTKSILQISPAVAAVLQRLAPPAAVLARFSRYRFAYILPPGRALRAMTLAKRILRAFEAPLRIEGGSDISFTATAGIAMATSDVTLDALGHDAESALDEALLSGAQILTYSDEIQEAQNRRAAIERNLRHAIRERRIGVVYQPVVSGTSRQITGAEALMRWDCPGIGPVPPAEFIAIAEQSGVIKQLGEWILREACAENRRWELAGLGPRTIAVNVSVQQLRDPGFLRLVHSVCESTKLPPARLELELTEGTMMDPNGIETRQLEALRRLGVRIAVDDFGTGYSSLSYLSKLPIDTLKLDRTFVATIATDPFQADLTASVIALAHRRGLQVVGEGIEESAQFEQLRAMGCDYVQGFLFSAAVSGEDFAWLLRGQNHAVT